MRLEWLKKWRRAYEKVRLLLELVQKRERLKLELVSGCGRVHGGGGDVRGGEW